jgi:hypothetical protein
MSPKFTLVALAVAAACPAAAQAFDFDRDVFTFSGFGTLGAVHSDEDQADFVGDPFQPDGAGYSEDWTFDVDSLLGLQVGAKFNDKVTAVVQVVAQKRWDNTFKPEIEWANIKYSITEDLHFRAGRIAMPTYLASDTRNVRYAMPTVRPSPEVYRLLPITNSDGVDLTYRFDAGSISNSVQLVYGSNRTSVTEGFAVKAEGVWAIVDTIEYKDLSVHLAYQGQQMNYELEGPFQIPNTSFKIKQIGVSYDPGKWFVSAEGARTAIDMSSSEAFTVTAGARVNSITPFAAFSKIKPVGLNTFTPADQTTATAGVRWDFMPNFDLKAQIDHIDLADGSAGNLVRVQPGFQPGGNVNVFSVSVDFVF